MPSDSAPEDLESKLYTRWVYVAAEDVWLDIEECHRALNFRLLKIKAKQENDKASKVTDIETAMNKCMEEYNLALVALKMCSSKIEMKRQKLQTQLNEVVAISRQEGPSAGTGTGHVIPPDGYYYHGRGGNTPEIATTSTDLGTSETFFIGGQGGSGNEEITEVERGPDGSSHEGSSQAHRTMVPMPSRLPPHPPRGSALIAKMVEILPDEYTGPAHDSDKSDGGTATQHSAEKSTMKSFRKSTKAKLKGLFNRKKDSK